MRIMRPDHQHVREIDLITVASEPAKDGIDRNRDVTGKPDSKRSCMAMSMRAVPNSSTVTLSPAFGRPSTQVVCLKAIIRIESAAPLSLQLLISGR